MNGPGVLALRALARAGGPADKAALDTVLTGLDLFVLSEHVQLPRYAADSTFMDQEFWRETGLCVAASGGRHAQAVHRMLKSKSAVVQYAAAAVVAKVGHTTAEDDRAFQVELFDLNNYLAKARISRKEHDARARLIADAREAVKAHN